MSNRRLESIAIDIAREDDEWSVAVTVTFEDFQYGEIIYTHNVRDAMSAAETLVLNTLLRTVEQ